ncbi:S8 family serine peptidase [Paenibacillus sp. TRM 82003]|nr:S8 family serine peptidase [Paenibacillus sp. TRM 82003]MCI3923447.1 S8 family serine peptidase [Paenibacillus sp. TRM 82003]
MKNTITTWIALAAIALAAACGIGVGRAAAETPPPNDPFYDKQRYMEQIHIRDAWAYIEATGRELEPVTVAVVDTGVHLEHPDLQGRLTTGRNILEPKSSPADDNGHGTSVAGVIAANANNGIGIAGIAPNVTILPVKAIGAKGIGEEEHLGQGIRYAVDEGADIIVLSLGLHLYSPYLAEIVAYAESKGVLLVAATGNDGIGSVRYPAAYPTVIAVGGASMTGEYKPEANFGPEVDLIAPWNVFTTATGDGYLNKNGTSMAAPQVAAVAALMLGLEPGLKPADIRERLRQSADPLLPHWNGQSGYGLLRADRAVSEAPKPDMYEPNDRRADAKPVSVAGQLQGEFAGAADRDWFVFEPPYKGEISVRVRDRKGGALKAELRLDRGDGRTPTEYDLSGGKEIRLSSPDGAKLYVSLRLTGVRDAMTPVPYQMDTDFHIYTDPYEPNDKAYEAYLLPTKALNEVTGTFHKIDDQDWYVMRIDSPGAMSMRLETDTWRIDPELYIVKEGGELAEHYDKAKEGKTEYVGSIPVDKGTYYIRVRNVKALYPLPVTGEYKLTVTYEKRFFDAFEPNNRSYQATTMTTGKTYKGVFDSAKDEDWFQIRVSRRSLVTIDLTGIPIDRYMYYTLYTSVTQQKFGKTSPFGTTTMRMVHDLEPGVYYIRLMTDAAFQDREYGIAFARAPLTAGFTDLEGHWSAASVERLVAKNIVKGYEDYTFHPAGTLTRAEAAAFIARAYALKGGETLQSFPDVPDTHWAKDSVNAAALKGILRGYPDGTFRPNDPVTRAEMAVMAAIASGTAGKTVPAGAGFSDVPQNHWAATHIHAFADAKLVQGFKDGTFRPAARSTRAEFAVLLANLLK